jgi:hypothetical protein
MVRITSECMYVCVCVCVCVYIYSVFDIVEIIMICGRGLRT